MTQRSNISVIYYEFLCFQPFYKGSGDNLIPLDPKVEREYDPLWPNDYEKVVKGKSPLSKNKYNGSVTKIHRKNKLNKFEL